MKFRVGVRFLLLALGGAVLAGCSSPTPQSVCERVASRERRCNTDGGWQQCEIDDRRDRCVIGMESYRSEALAALNSCRLEETPCGSEGDMMLLQCLLDATRQLPLTTAYRDLVNAMCERCPGSGAASDPAACVNTLTHLPSLDDLTLILSATIISSNDSALQRATTCIDAITQSGSEACRAIGECLRLVNPLEVNPVPSSCSADGGM
jgi:hypothetical protein